MRRIAFAVAALVLVGCGDDHTSRGARDDDFVGVIQSNDRLLERTRILVGDDLPGDDDALVTALGDAIAAPVADMSDLDPVSFSDRYGHDAADEAIEIAWWLGVAEAEFADRAPTDDLVALSTQVDAALGTDSDVAEAESGGDAIRALAAELVEVIPAGDDAGGPDPLRDFLFTYGMDVDDLVDQG